MAGKIIGFICCFMCGIPFWAIAAYNKNSKEPISFWSGDRSLKDKVKDVANYNREMAMVYKIYAVAYVLAAVGFLFHPIAGVTVLVADCTVGIFFVCRAYKKILSKYS